MPWQEESTMELRRQFVQDVQSGATPVTELWAAYGISRKTGYRVARPLRRRRPRRSRFGRFHERTYLIEDGVGRHRRRNH